MENKILKIFIIAIIYMFNYKIFAVAVPTTHSEHTYTIEEKIEIIYEMTNSIELNNYLLENKQDIINLSHDSHLDDALIIVNYYRNDGLEMTKKYIKENYILVGYGKNSLIFNYILGFIIIVGVITVIIKILK